MRHPIVGLVSAPAELADGLATSLVEGGLAACVNVISGVRSVYRWRGEVSRDDESLLVIKTTADLVEAIRAVLATAHPYELFELVTLHIEGGNPPYLDWIAESVREL